MHFTVYCLDHPGTLQQRLEQFLYETDRIDVLRLCVMKTRSTSRRGVKVSKSAPP